MPNIVDLYKLIKTNNSKYTIFCDMDGVLVDFTLGYYNLTDSTLNSAQNQTENDFWDTFTQKIKEKNLTECEFWSNLTWTKDGEELWEYISPYSPSIISAPSPNPESIQGKSNWLYKNIGFISQTIFSSAEKKPNYAKKSYILIDDREDTIREWNNRGGIGIYHMSTSSTIKELKKLNL